MLAAGIVPESPREAARLGFFGSPGAATKAYQRGISTAPSAAPSSAAGLGGQSYIGYPSRTMSTLGPVSAISRLFSVACPDPASWRRVEYVPPGPRSRRTACWTRLPPGSVRAELRGACSIVDPAEGWGEPASKSGPVGMNAGDVPSSSAQRFRRFAMQVV
jgi:hypothetical protein